MQECNTEMKGGKEGMYPGAVVLVVLYSIRIYILLLAIKLFWEYIKIFLIGKLHKNIHCIFPIYA